MTSLNVAPMMWHIIDAHIKGVTPPFSGDEEMDELLEEIYDKQKFYLKINFCLAD